VAAFAEQAAVILGDINYIHPFREGNGRTQLQYLKQLAEQAGHRLDLTLIEGPRWIAASVASHAADYQPMAAALAKALKSRSGGR
jgi:cell filamentation protein